MTTQIIQADYNNPQHANDLIQVLDAYAQDPMGGGEPLSEYAKQHLVPSLAKRADALSVLAYDGEQAIGLINCFEGFSTFYCKPLLNIHDVVVIKAYRGYGISQLMLQAIETMARQRDCCKLTLEVLSNNRPAISAYEKFGFKPYQLDPAAGQALFCEKRITNQTESEHSLADNAHP